MDVWFRQTWQFFAMSAGNRQPSGEADEHGYLWMKNIFTTALAAYKKAEIL
ncbi:MAG: hypothetical protein IJ420_08220 [Lachnospiraceae bacterium]|nr:hypothetical protein [Lachnospiraceae bacterium]